MTDLETLNEHPAFVNAGHEPREYIVSQFCGPLDLKTVHGEKGRKCILISTIGENGLTVGHIRLTESQAKDLVKAIANAYLPFNLRIPADVEMVTAPKRNLADVPESSGIPQNGLDRM